MPDKGVASLFSQKTLLFEPLDSAYLIKAFFAHHERQHSPTLSGLEVVPCSCVERQPE